MHWELLQTENEWEQYKSRLAKELRTVGLMWGRPPVEYPCLVASVPLSPAKVASAFVYRRDFNLFGPAAPAAPAANTPQVSAPVREAVTPKQSDFNKWVCAYMLALTYYVRETLVVKDAAFEQKVAEMLALTDQVVAAQRDQLSKVEQDMLERFAPGTPSA